MAGIRNRQLFALWCATALLGLLWSQVFARYGIRATLFVLLETVLLAAMWRAWQHEPPARSAWTLSGVLAGISFYSYLPARLLPLLLLILLGAAWLQECQRLRRHLPGMLGGIVAALLVSAPLGSYFLQNPLAFSTRIGEVTTGVGLKEVFANLGDVLGMFLGSGDHNLVSNVPDRPVLGPFLALPFLIGLGMTLRRPWRLGRLFLHLLHVEGEGLFAQLAGFDHPPGNGTCPMTEWLPAEMVVHEAEMNLPAVLPPGELFLAVGFYTPSDGRRMPVSLAADDHILIGPLTQTP